MSYWLMKSEPSAFSIDDLAKCRGETNCWDGVRNYQARNYLRDAMQQGDLAFFYHSSCKTPGIVGIIEIVSAAYPDYTAFDPNSKYFDSKSNSNEPRWFMRDVKLNKKFNTIITLDAIRTNPNLSEMVILRKGNRLSITPVTPDQWQAILSMQH